MAGLMKKRLTAKQRDAGANVSALEREIDDQVYALYGLPRRIRPLADLTPEEIKIVEGQTA